nr:cation transporter [uncultured Carboxylicivirga sp.]
MKVIGVVVLVIALFSCHNRNQRSSVKEIDSTNIVEIVMNIEGMTCEGCEVTIERGLLKLDGVIEVKADHNTGIAKVKADTVNLNKDDITRIINKVGYRVKE